MLIRVNQASLGLIISVPQMALQVALYLPCAVAPNPKEEDSDPTYATLAVHDTAKQLPAKVCKMRPSHGI